DEVLFQAGIDPRRSARTLTDAEARRLHARLRSVLETAVRARADSDRYPRRWLFHRRWDRRGAGGRVREAAIRYDTIGGRTTAWIPTVQK
ncbi:MAG: Fpg/Nei family DNA glycosylase, partial [Candidatus Rokuibacteriota bacterium]